jgi:hypothetical protein
MGRRKKDEGTWTSRDPHLSPGVVIESLWGGEERGPIISLLLDRTWEIRVAFSSENGNPVVVDFHVLPYEPGLGESVPPGGLTARTLRRVRLGDAFKALREMAEGLGPPAPGPELLDVGITATPGERQPRRRGRKPFRDVDYAIIASAYVRLVGTVDHPVATLAGERQLSQDRVRKMLQQARRRSLLTPAPPGRPGGSLTAKARRLLASRPSEGQGDAHG